MTAGTSSPAPAWMPGTSPGMTKTRTGTNPSVMAGLVPAIHGRSAAAFPRDGTEGRR